MSHNVDTWRPVGFDEYIGQAAVKEELRVHIAAAIAQDRPLPHIFLYGPPGAGKTSLAKVLEDETGDEMHAEVCPIDLRVLTDLVTSHEGILFLDEIHNLKRSVQEAMLPLLEFGHIKHGRFTVKSGWLTIVAGTTERQAVIKPLRDRFPIKPRFAAYTDEEMNRICLSMAVKAGLELDAATCSGIARAAGGVPRTIRNILTAADALQASEGSMPSLDQILGLLGIDSDGLTPDERHYLFGLRDLGGVAGLDTLSNFLHDSPATLRETERTLVRKGMIVFTSRGRELTSMGHRRIRGPEVSGRRRLERTAPVRGVG